MQLSVPAQAFLLAQSELEQERAYLRLAQRARVSVLPLLEVRSAPVRVFPPPA